MSLFLSAIVALSVATNTVLPPVNKVIADVSMSSSASLIEITEMEVVFKTCDNNLTAQYQEATDNGFNLYGEIVLSGQQFEYDYKKAEYVVEEGKCIFRAWNE